ncbi:MAG: alpha/beta fold hydrolase [Cyanobacteria bacterium P01_A01_bin.15]
MGRVSSDAPLLIFLPGMDGSDLSLRRQLGGLTTAFETRCFCLPEDDTTDWMGLVKHLVALVEPQSDRPVFLCGESFGACLALGAISYRPDLFDRLILINPASSFNRQLWSGLGAPLVRWIPGIPYRFAALGLLPFLAALERIAEGDRQALLQAMQAVTPESAAWRLALMRDFRLQPSLLATVKRPVLLVASTADRLLPSVNEVQKLAAIFPNAQTVTLQNSGHACLLEKDISLYKILRQAQFAPTVAV